VELKLELTRPEDAAALAEDRALRRAGRGRARTESLRSVYWDTPDLALHRRGIGLRLRDAARGRVQTVKGPVDASAGLFERREDEAPVAGSEPDLAAVADTALRDALHAETTDRGLALAPVVETQVRRTERRLLRGDAEIAFCLDVGEVRTARGAQPIREVELELVRGEPAVLFELALELLERAPLRPATLGKAERGFALLTGEAAAPSKARALQVAPDVTLDQLLAAAFGEGLRQVSANAAPAERGVDPEGVHQLRVGARRLRSLLSLFREALPAEPAALLREELRWLGRALGPARDLDVFLAELVGPRLERRPDDGGMKRLRDEARAARDEAYRAVRETLASRRFARLLLALGRFTVARGWREQPLTEASARLFFPGVDAGRPLLDRRWKKARRRARVLRAEAPAPAAALHELRIECKKLRYASEFLAPLYPGKAAARFAKRLARLQDRLGHLNDAATAEELTAALLARMGAEAGPAHHHAAGFLVGHAAHAAEQRLEGLPRDWERLEKVGAFWR
jgi:inorganic triphosphatase YgiF